MRSRRLEERKTICSRRPTFHPWHNSVTRQNQNQQNLEYRSRNKFGAVCIATNGRSWALMLSGNKCSWERKTALASSFGMLGLYGNFKGTIVFFELLQAVGINSFSRADQGYFAKILRTCFMSKPRNFSLPMKKHRCLSKVCCELFVRSKRTASVATIPSKVAEEWFESKGVYA